MVGPYRPPCETPRAEPPSAKPSGVSRWVLPATILGSSMSFIDGSVVNVALPAMQRDLGTSLAAMQWAVNGYMLTLASLILLGGAAGDRFGRRRIFMIGLASFAVASAGCGLAPSAGWLVAARLVQGAAAALLVPSSLAIIGAAYGGEARGRAIGTWAAAGALTTALGPPLGGWLVDTVGWRTIFFINLPIAVAALTIALKLPADRGGGQRALDVKGALLAIAALGLLSYGLIALGEGERWRGAATLAAALVLGALFVRAEARAAAPMIPLTLFESRNFAAANALTVLLYAALGGALFLLPFLLISVHDYSAAAAGAAFLPFSIVMGLGSRWTGSLADRIGPRTPLTAGPILTGAGFALLGLSAGEPSYWSGVFPGLLVVSIGMTLSVAPLTTTVFASAPDEQSGTASGINNAAARAGSLVAVAALGIAYGGSGAAIEGAALAEAYRIVMFATAGLAVAGGLFAAAAIERQAKAAS